MWTCSLCCIPVAENHNFWQILTFGGSCTGPPFTDKGQIWCAKADRKYTFTWQISSECVHCVGFRWPKTTILSKFWLLGAPVPTPFYQWGPNLVFYSRLTAHVYVAKFVSIGLFYRPLAVFWISAFSNVDSWRESGKVEHGCTTTNFPLSNGIKVISVLQRLYGGRNRANKLWRSEAWRS